MTTLKDTTYEPLTTDTAIKLSKDLQLFNEDDLLFAHEIGDGNLNLVFRIQEELTGKSIIIKQALPYAKVVGTSWPLTLDRSRIESESLKRTYQLVPNYTPKVYYSDSELAVTVMDDLSHLTIVRKGLIEAVQYPKLAKDIGLFLAHTLFYNSDFGLNQQEKKIQSGRFINPELCKITEDLVFTDPFFDHDTNNIDEQLKPFVAETIWADQSLKLEVAQLKQTFLTKAETLLHGDLHTGSIFANDDETVVIDPEFAYYGPIGFDIGAFVANIILNYLSQDVHLADHPDKKAEFQKYLLTVITETWNVFEEEFTVLWNKHPQDAFMNTNGYLGQTLDQIFKDMIGFAGCKVIRRMIGLAGVEDVEAIIDLKVRNQVKQRALSLGKEIILNRKDISSIEHLVKVVTKYA
ncbi:S-methyl-5-thioribose kinase [Halalkalibacter krulwichiae]|uniref:Methylthioribose kinase n=1 Tax=Halalkalibacter krulwichiae TaxID=199441 RepID=A0A1X9M7X6_9BACI|nr:S-methyl-5-thioribose kinase [Halalkalibacter krulwichiae]ARK29516.1 Methylthioribose kinase [Halalkalibacter krulwichiae]